jgi:hypothetical protein
VLGSVAVFSGDRRQHFVTHHSVAVYADELSSKKGPDLHCAERKYWRKNRAGGEVRETERRQRRAVMLALSHLHHVPSLSYS